jgi:hypothetical protein
METMHAAGRRRLPPVPRASAEPAGTHEPTTGTTEDAATERWAIEPGPEVDAGRAQRPADAPRRRSPAQRERPRPVEQDAAQEFVARLRASADDFAAAAGATSAIVREAVPPARHRRSRCLLVLRFADDTEAEVLLLGPAGAPGFPSRHGFDRQIRRWLRAGRVRHESWLVPDPGAPDGVAVDVSAWVAAS